MSDKIPEECDSVGSDYLEVMSDESVTDQSSNASEDTDEIVKGGACNYAFEASLDDGEPSTSLDSHSRQTLHSHREFRQFRSAKEDKAMTDFMSTSTPPGFQRSKRKGVDGEKDDSAKKTFILMSSMASRSEDEEAPGLFVEETDTNIELAETLMSGATGVDANVDDPKSEFTEESYEPSWKRQESYSHPKPSCSKDGDPPASATSFTTFAAATAAFMEQRKQQATITPVLDQYYRNRPTAIVADEPAPSDREVLVDNQAPVDVVPPPEGNPQDGGGTQPPVQDGWMDSYFKYATKIVNSRAMFIIWGLISCWSSFCIYWGIKYMNSCLSMDTIPFILVFLGITSLGICLTRMLLIGILKTLDYPKIVFFVRCVQSVMLLTYLALHLLDILSLFLLHFKKLQDKCAHQYYTFIFWNVWVQITAVVILTILHAPSVYKSKMFRCS